MATILLTDEEYNDIKTLLDAATAKIENASPRAATHYAVLARLHSDFLAREDSKRTLKSVRASRRAEIDQRKQARRAAALAAAQKRQQEQAAAAQSAAQKAGGQQAGQQTSTGRASRSA